MQQIGGNQMPIPLLEKPKSAGGLGTVLGRAVGLLVIASVAYVTPEAPAKAQSDDAARSRLQVEDIIVTGRKREERLLDAPIAATALNNQALKNYHTSSLGELTTRIPGVDITQNGAGGAAGGNIVMRGMGQLTIDYGGDQPVSIVIDGMSFSRGHILNVGFFDTETVEVLKGPQALYFGKNSMAGVISVRSVTPEVGAPMEGFLRASYEFIAEDPVLEGAISFPIGDKVAMRIAARGQFMQDGWLKNTAEPLPADMFGESGAVAGGPTRGASFDKWPQQRQQVLRWTTVLEPNDKFDATLKLFYSRDKQNDAGNTILVGCADGVGSHPYLNTVFFGMFQDTTQTCSDKIELRRNSALPPAEIANNMPFLDESMEFFNRHKNFIGTLEMNYQVADWLKITSVTGYWDYKHREYTNYDYTSYAVVVSQQGESGHSFTQELRAETSLEGRVNLMIGGFYEKSERDLDAPVRIFPLPPCPPGFFGNCTAEAGGLYDGTYAMYHQHWDNDIESYSLFAQATIDITDSIELSGGLRYTNEKRYSIGGNIFESTGGIVFSQGLTQGGVFYEPSAKDDNVSPEVTLSWKPSEDTLIYASYKTGFHSFGISNPGTVTNFDAINADVNDVLIFDSSTSEGFEIGVKGMFFDKRFSTSLVGFRYEFNDLQVASYDPITVSFVTQNAAKARNMGLEWEGTFAATENLSLRYSLSYVHMKYVSWPQASCYTGQQVVGSATYTPELGALCMTDPIEGFDFQDLSGERFGGPPFQFNIGFTYDQPLGNAWGLTVTGDMIFHNGGQRVLRQPDTNIKSREVLNLSASVYQSDGPLEVSLICSNCLNEKYVTSIGNKSLAQIGDLTGQVARPRLVTLQLTYRFGS